MREERLSPLRALLSHVFLWALGATMVVPFGWMVLTAFKSDAEIFAGGILPRAASYGPDGTHLQHVNGQPLFTEDGQPLRLVLGNPTMNGSKGDQATNTEGVSLTDDEGVPVLNGQLSAVAGDGGFVRFRDPRQMAKFAEPVLISRQHQPPGNEEAAKRYFTRISDWEKAVATRWRGAIPLMVTPALQDAWHDRGGRPDPLTWGQHRVLDPFSRDGAVPYVYRDCSWADVDKPVRYRRRANVVVDNQGLPLVFRPGFPTLTLPDRPVAGPGGPLRLRIGAATAATAPLLVRDVNVHHQVRFVTANISTVLADRDIRLSLYAWNSVVVCCGTVLLQVLTSALAAFAFARLQWPGRDRVFIAYLATLMVPGVVTAIPNYLILQQLGWLNTFWALIVPGAASAYGTFMLRQYMLTLPKGLEEAARIDGAGLLRVWWDIVLPLCRPALVTLAIFTFVGTWQSFAWPLIVAPDESVRLLPVALQKFATAQSTSYHLLMAASLLMMLPMLLLFILGQRYFVRGIALGGVKG